MTTNHIPTPAQALIIEACYELSYRAEFATGTQPRAIFASPDIMETIEWKPGHEAKVNGIPMVCDSRMARGTMLAV